MSEDIYLPMYLPWFKYKKRKEFFKTGLIKVYPKELLVLLNKKLINREELRRIEQMLDSSDKESQEMGETIILQLRRTRLRNFIKKSKKQ
jgi:hypothetical protein